MVTEIAIFDVREGEGDAFLAAFHDRARDLLVTTPGCRGTRMLRSQETPTRFVGVTEWDSVRHHVDNFVETDRYAAFGAAVLPHLAGPPRIEHFDDV